MSVGWLAAMLDVDATRRWHRHLVAFRRACTQRGIEFVPEFTRMTRPLRRFDGNRTLEDRLDLCSQVATAPRWRRSQPKSGGMGELSKIFTVQGGARPVSRSTASLGLHETWRGPGKCEDRTTSRGRNCDASVTISPRLSSTG